MYLTSGAFLLLAFDAAVPHPLVLLFLKSCAVFPQLWCTFSSSLVLWFLRTAAVHSASQPLLLFAFMMLFSPLLLLFLTYGPFVRQPLSF
jgi:hypothetical protein